MSNSLFLCRGTLFLLISLLAACGGDLSTADGDTIASDGDGSTPQLSDRPAMSEAAAAGKTAYEKMDQGCADCHGVDGKADTFKAIDLEAERYEHSSVAGTDYSLEEYLTNWMPVGDPSICIGDCATNIAAYLRYLGGSQPAVDDPVTDDPVTDDPVTDNPVTDDPATDNPVVDEPVVDNPVVDEPSNNGPLARNGWLLSASSNGGELGNATDGSAQTRWTTEAFQKSGQSFEIDLQTPTTFNRIALDSEESPQDFPRGYDVFVSADGVNWGQSIRSGAGQEGTTVIDVNTVTARHVRITQTGSSTNRWWSIHEVNLFLKGDSGPIVAPPVDEPPVTNVTPAVRFSQPSGGAEIAFGSAINVQANASDSDGSVVNVTLYLNGALIGQELSSPYTWSSSNDAGLNNLAVGSYTLTAVAIDNDGATANVDLSITINPAPPEFDGVALYGQYCAGCHQPLNVSTKSNRSAEQIRWGIDTISRMQSLAFLSDAEINAIAGVLRTESAPLACAPSSSQRLWRLDDEQYGITIAALLNGRSGRANNGLEAPAGIAMPLGVVSGTESMFTTNTNVRRMLPNDAEGLVNASVPLAELMLDDAQIASCVSGNGPLGECLKAPFLAKAELLFRRPATDEDVAHYLDTAQAAVDSRASRSEATREALQALLISPYSVLRRELGGDQSQGDRRPLTAFEIAEALSYSLTSGPPDVALWEDAKSNELLKIENIESHIERLVNDGNQLPLRKFVRELFAYDQMPNESDGSYQPDALLREAEAFTENVVRMSVRNDFFKALLTSSNGYDSIERLGILGHPAWLSSHATDTPTHPERTPIARGKVVLERLLCQELPEPPELVDENGEPIPLSLQPLAPGDTTTGRERVEMHTVEACASCHRAMDGIGFGFERFDYRGLIIENLVDDSGELFIEDGHSDNGTYAGLEGMAAKLHTSEIFNSCMTERTFEFFMGREPNEGDDCTIQEARDRYNEGGDLVEMLKAFFTSDAFLYRTP